jgi:hypothetical protein
LDYQFLSITLSSTPITPSIITMPADYDLIPKQPLEALNKTLSIDLKGVGLSLEKLACFIMLY